MGEAMTAFTVQINCGSGMQSIDTAYQYIREGHSDLVLAGGTDALSWSPLIFRKRAVDWYARLFGAPDVWHRIEALAQALQMLGPRRITVGRELTKQFEDITTVSAQSLPDWLQASPYRTRGEFALVVHAQPQARATGSDNDRLLKILMQELPLKTAVKVAAEISGEAKNALYDRALELKQATSS